MTKTLTILSAVVLAAVTILTVLILSEKDTQLTGVPAELTGAYAKPLTLTVTISPARGRQVVLQRKEDGKWVDAATAKAGSGDSGTAVLKFPSDWGRNSRTSWRIVAPHVFMARAYEGKSFTTVPGNLHEIAGLEGKAALILRVSDGQLIYARNIHARLANASTTKMMTALLTMDQANSDAPITVSKRVKETHDGNLYKEVGDRFRTKDLWRAMLIASSNDSAVAIAESAGGSEEAFVEKMNAKAKALGMKDTHYENAFGWDAAAHYSSAYDLSILLRACMKNTTFQQVVMMKKYEFTALNDGKRLNIVNTTNWLLKHDYPGNLGGKTGQTENAQGCYAGMVEYKGKKYVVVLLGSKHRWKDMVRLLTYLRTEYAGESPAAVQKDAEGEAETVSAGSAGRGRTSASRKAAA